MKEQNIKTASAYDPYDSRNRNQQTSAEFEAEMTAAAQPENNATMFANSKFPNTGDWQTRHNSAITQPRDGFESAVASMLKGWREYAETVNLRYGSKIGDDYVLGPEWQKIGEGIKGLLNGELGRLDAGTLDAFINETLTANGIVVNA